MTRHPDWEKRLGDFLKERTGPFVWGVNDCCLFACDAVLAITGTDIASDFRGKYSTAREAYECIKAFAGGGLTELAEKRATEMGMSIAGPRQARRGDVVLVLNGGHPSLGIVGLDGMFAHCAGASGPVRIPMKEWLKAFRV